MQIFDDNIDSSINKLRAIFQQGFKVVKSNQLQSDKKELINEITNEILKQIEEYLVDINNVTIDQVCGRIENKINNFDTYDILLDDESLNEIKKCIDENINVVNYQEEIKSSEKIEKTEIIENKNSSYISPGQQIAQTLSIIGFQEKLDQLSGFFDENKKDVKVVSKNKKRKKFESVLSKLTGIFSFPLMILGRYRAPKWLTSDLVSPMFFEILENNIGTNLEKTIQKTADIAKNAIINNKKLLSSFEAERKLNDSLISHNKKLAKENRQLALDLITTKLKDVLVKIKDNTVDTFKNLKNTLITFKDIAFTIIDMVLFIANIALRVISLLFTYLLNIAIFSFTCIVNLSILLFYLILVTTTFIFATLFVVGSILLTGIIVSALFLAALAIISIVSLAIAAIIVILGAIVMATIFMLTMIAIATILTVTFLLTNILLITTQIFYSILVVLADAIIATSILFADIILMFAVTMSSLISAITIPFGFIAVTTIAIFTFFATMLATTLFAYSSLMLNSAFVILSFAFLTISMMYAIALAALAFSMVLLASAILALGIAINLTALLVFLILFGISAFIVYKLSKLAKKLLKWLIKKFDEHQSTIDNIVFKFINPVVDYIQNALDKFLSDKDSLVKLQQKIDSWLKSTPDKIKTKIVQTIRQTISNILDICYSFIKDKVEQIVNLLPVIVDKIFDTVFNNEMVSDFIYRISVMYNVYRLGEEKIKKLTNKIQQWHDKETEKAAQWAANEMKARGIVKERAWWDVIGKAADMADQVIRGRGVINEGIERVEGLPEINKLLKWLPDDVVPIALGYASPDLLYSFDKENDIPKVSKLTDLAQELRQSEIDSVQKQFDEIFDENVNENDDVTNQQLQEIDNKKSQCDETLIRISNKLSQRMNTVALNTNQNDTNQALNG